MWISGSIAMGFSGTIFPVHPSAESIMGLKAYKSVLDIPADVDLAIFTIPLAGVVEVLKQCIEKGIRFVHLLTAGFSETGKDELMRAEEEILQIAQSGGIRLIGPNCMGMYCPGGGLAWNAVFPKRSGSVSLLSQSGQLAFEIVMGTSALATRFNKVVSFGNASDLKAYEFLAYLAADEQTKIIAAYLEGLRDGRQFYEIACRVTPQKPLVVWKGGQTSGGSRATQSHTAAIAGSQAIWEAMCRQAGIISVHTQEEMIYTLQALELMPLPTGSRVAILGGAGGGSVTMTDFAEKEGLSVPLLSDKTIEQLDLFVPLEGSSARNPMDIMPVLFNETYFHRVMELLDQASEIDAVIFALDTGWLLNALGRQGMDRFVGSLVDFIKKSKKPFFISLNQSESPQIAFIREELVGWFNRERIATFPEFAMAARILNNLKLYRDFLGSCC